MHPGSLVQRKKSMGTLASFIEIFFKKCVINVPWRCAPELKVLEFVVHKKLKVESARH
jgi:hypothetical protein